MNTIGNANNIRWGCFDIIPQATGTGYNIKKVPAKTNENTLYIPIANSLYMEEYKIEDLVNFLYQESNYFNNLLSGNKLTHPSTLWYLERENCLAINFPSVSSSRMKTSLQEMLFEPTRIPDTTTKGLYYNMMGINPNDNNNTEVQNVLSTTGEKHCEVFGLIKCDMVSSYKNYYTFCKAKDLSGNDVYIVDKPMSFNIPNPDPNAFIDCNVGPVFHLDTDKVCDHQFEMPYTTNRNSCIAGSVVGRNPTTTNNFSAYPPYMVFGKKTGNTGELAVSVQARGTYMYLKDGSEDNLMYFMKYDTNNSIQVCVNSQLATHIHFNPKIAGIRPLNTPITTKKFTLYYLGDATNTTGLLVFHSSFIDLEDNTTRYEALTGSDPLLGMKLDDPAIVNTFEADITYVQPGSDPFGISQGKVFRFLIITNGSLHGKKLWKYQSTIPTDFLNIYQSGSLYHGFANPNNLQLTTGDLFEIREEIPMTICSFGPCGESETDPVKATTIQTGYRHVYMAVEIYKSGSYFRVSHNYNYSQECIFGPYGSFNTVQNGHDFYFVKLLDLNILETVFGYKVVTKTMSLNTTSNTPYIYDINMQSVGYNKSGDKNVVTYGSTQEYVGYSYNNYIASMIGCISPLSDVKSSNYFSVARTITPNANVAGSNKGEITAREDNLFIVYTNIPVSIEIYLQKV